MKEETSSITWEVYASEAGDLELYIKDGDELVYACVDFAHTPGELAHCLTSLIYGRDDYHGWGGNKCDELECTEDRDAYDYYYNTTEAAGYKLVADNHGVYADRCRGNASSSDELLNPDMEIACDDDDCIPYGHPSLIVPPVTLVEVDWHDDLYEYYDGQDSCQPCYIELDLQDKTLSADWSAEVGNGCRAGVYNGHTRQYSIPCLTATAANRLMAEIMPLACKVLRGYKTCDENGRTVAVLDDLAEAAEDEIRKLCAGSFEDEDVFELWDCSTYFENDPPDVCAGDDIHKLARKLMKDVPNNIKFTDDLETYLKGIAS